MKKRIAVVFGGCSSEYAVSLQSAFSALSNLDPSRYDIVPIGITQQGDWFWYHGPYENIGTDAWRDNEYDLTSCVISPSQTTHGLVIFSSTATRTLRLDAVFPIMHGKQGEDGTIQGLCELAGIPVIGCDALSSALCMDKDKAHKLVADAGVEVPRSYTISKQPYLEIQAATLAREVGYPLFVKPVKAGSSLGVSRVESRSELMEAIDNAFEHDDAVLLEEAISGFEIGCAVVGTDALMTGELDEVELSGGFFNYVEKYSLETSEIHVPARITAAQSEAAKETAKTIYRALGCKHFARVDMFLTSEGRIIFNEVNTIPGFTEHSRFPNMMKAVGFDFEDLLSYLIDCVLHEEASVQSAVLSA